MKKKSVILFTLCSLGIANLAFASTDEETCKSKAVHSVEKKFKKYFIENGKRIRIIENDMTVCERIQSQRGPYYRSCEVKASNGEGAGDMTFGAKLTDDCNRAYATFILGEE